MNVQLQIKRESLDQILAGEKKEDFREVTDTNIRKFCEVDADGNAIALKKFETIEFHNGYKALTERPVAIVAVKSFNCMPIRDENDEIITDDEGNEEAMFVFDLGKIISRVNC